MRCSLVGYPPSSQFPTLLSHWLNAVVVETSPAAIPFTERYLKEYHMEALSTVIITLAILFLIWWLSLDRPVRSLSRSLNTLASAGEVKAVNVLVDVVGDIEADKLTDLNAKLKTIQELDL